MVERGSPVRAPRSGWSCRRRPRPAACRLRCRRRGARCPCARAGRRAGAGGDVPQADGPVFPRGGEQGAVGMKSHVDGAPLMTLELGDFLAAGNLPEPDRPVVAAGGQQRACGVHGRPRVSTPGGDGLGECVDDLSGRQVPEDGAALTLDRGELAAIAADGHGADDRGLVLEQAGLATGRGVPEARRAVPGRRRHLLAIGAERHVVDEALVPAQDAVAFEEVHIPDTHRPISGPGDEGGPVGREDRRIREVTAVSAEHADQISGPRVPESQRGILRGSDDARAVRAEDDMPHDGRVPAQDGQQSSRLPVPEPRRMISR